MAKKNSPSRGKTEPKAEEKPEKNKSAPRDSMREMVESIVIAFVLAFLFRTFEAEAFVIPTGSMAPTLMGRHKDLKCSKCGHRYRVSASDEERRDGADWGSRAQEEANKVVASICPVCRYQMNFGPGGPEASEPHASYKGDRILVAKFPYEFSDPNRWDVAVFKNPSRAKENYIKRVVGLPNETLIISRGDIHTTQQDLTYETLDVGVVAKMRQEGVVEIERKPPSKVEAMLQVVHDNDNLPPRMPLRWEQQTPGWEILKKGQAFEYDGKVAGDALILYNHLLPKPGLWERLDEDPELIVTAEQTPAQLITDFYAYNTSEQYQTSPRYDTDVFGNHWVGDLAIECSLEVKGAQGEAILQLVEGGQVFECRIDVASGKAQFSLPGTDADKMEAQTAVRGPGTYRLRFANVDDQLLLWVNGKSVAFDGRYGPLGNLVPNRDDLAPARLGSNGVAVAFDHLRILRDVYYIAVNTTNTGDFGHLTDFDDPTKWKALATEPAVSFPLAADQFLVLGDNSPRSQDSRLWRNYDEEGRPEHYVKRELLIGKAVYIYWPHPLPFPGLPDTWWFPFLPNIPRMGFVR
jgi:signal peptidase I